MHIKHLLSGYVLLHTLLKIKQQVLILARIQWSLVSFEYLVFVSQMYEINTYSMRWKPEMSKYLLKLTLQILWLGLDTQEYNVKYWLYLIKIEKKCVLYTGRESVAFWAIQSLPAILSHPIMHNLNLNDLLRLTTNIKAGKGTVIDNGNNISNLSSLKDACREPPGCSQHLWTKLTYI